MTLRSCFLINPIDVLRDCFILDYYSIHCANYKKNYLFACNIRTGIFILYYFFAFDAVEKKIVEFVIGICIGCCELIRVIVKNFISLVSLCKYDNVKSILVCL